MYFDFEDYRPDIEPLAGVISNREAVLLSIIVHLVAVIALMTLPQWVGAHRVVPPPEAAAANKPDEEPLTFVFVRPRVDERAPTPPPRGELSDENRRARAPERAENPTNPLPLSRGNTSERVERLQQERAQGNGPRPEPSPPAPPQEPDGPDRAARVPDSQTVMALPTPAPPAGTGAPARPLGGGSLGDALRNLERYVQNQQLQNPRGGVGDFGPAIQFDTMGVDFGRWILRFKAQVERNWFPLIPQAAMSMSGHVVLTFNVHKNGSITDLTMAKPARVDGFNHAAYGAMVSSNPTIPLPPEYPADKAFFTVTFFYNESPP
jgi:TonB family protein